MWDRRIVLGAIVFTALYYSVAAEHAELLDMAPNAVDYSYSKCRKDAVERFIHSGVLSEELKSSKGFQRAWNLSTQCAEMLPGGLKEHTAALLAYENGDDHFIKSFNNGVETLGANVSNYENHFNFKSFHFLLTDYMMLQKTETCMTVYVISDIPYTAQKGSEVRLGSFIRAHVSLEMEDLDGLSILNISSCFFVKLGQNICKEGTDHVLLSPAEVFTVENVTSKSDQDSQHQEILLKHSSLKHSNGCHIHSRSPAVVSTQWLVSVLVALSIFLFNC